MPAATGIVAEQAVCEQGIQQHPDEPDADHQCDGVARLLRPGTNGGCNGHDCRAAADTRSYREQRDERSVQSQGARQPRENQPGRAHAANDHWQGLQSERAKATDAESQSHQCQADAQHGAGSNYQPALKSRVHSDRIPDEYAGQHRQHDGTDGAAAKIEQAAAEPRGKEQGAECDRSRQRPCPARPIPGMARELRYRHR